MFVQRLAAAAALSLGLATLPAHAAVVFSDSFDANARGLNRVPAGWTVSNGTVDIIGTGFFDLQPGNGNYIDLDGSVGNAGDLSIQLTLTGGVLHTLSYDLAGSQRGDRNTVNIAFGSSTDSQSLASSVPFSTFTLDFTPLATGSYTLMFSHAGGDNLGLLLDRVVVTSFPRGNVPEPASLALALLGLAAAGAARRRKA